MRATRKTSELWTLEQGTNAIRCLAASHPCGIEVRYVINEHPLMSRVLPDWADGARVAETWRKSLEAQGWEPPYIRHLSRRH
ncbi:MAG: hypothetical protein AB7I50_02780 [Vicinamibacterales bacterium]